MKQKTILFITKEIVPFYYGGIGTLFMSVSNLMKSLGHKVYFLTQKRDDFDFDIFDKYYGGISVLFVNALKEDEFIDYSPSGGILSTFNAAYAFSVEEAFNQLFEKTPPDIVVTADFGAEAWALLLRKALGAYPETCFVLHLSGALRNVLETYQGVVKEGEYNELNEPRNKLVCSMEDTCMLLADEVVSPSYSAWISLCSRLDLPRAKGKIIPNLLSKEFQRILENRKIDADKQIDKMVLFIGRLDRLKGADILLELYLEYTGKYNIKSKLIFIGRDCFCKEYDKTFIEEWEEKIPTKYRDQVIFAGQLNHDKIGMYLKKATVCVFPSRWEVFGIVCLEAMAYGVPVLVSKKTGFAELLGDNLRANTFDFSNEKELFFERLHEILVHENNNLELREKVKARAAEIVNQGERGYKSFVEGNREKNHKNGLSDSVLNRLLISLKILSDISGFLSHDFMKLKKFYGASDDDVKMIIQQGKTYRKSIFQKLSLLIK